MTFILKYFQGTYTNLSVMFDAHACLFTMYHDDIMMITLFSKNVVHHEQGKKSNLLQVAKKYVIVITL